LLDRLKLHFLHNPYGEVTETLTKRKFRAIDLVANYLAKIHHKLFEDLDETYKIKGAILYVITVPSIWSDAAVQAMRDALSIAKIISGINAGEEECMFVLEPEAASAFIKMSADTMGLIFKNGTVYLMVDAGGGTVDLTLHKIEDNKLRELTIRSGAKCGSTVIDDAFFSWLASCFAPNTLTEYFQEFPGQAREFRNEWEKVKLKTEDYTEQKVPVAEHFYKKVVDRALAGNTVFVVNANRGKYWIKLSAANMEFIFKPVISAVVNLVKEQQDKSPEKIEYLVLVGGFGLSPILKTALVTGFTDIKIKQPLYSDEAVVQGGVYLGLDPSLIKTRRSKLTYGIAVQEEWMPEHGEDKLVVENNRFVCKNVFFRFVLAGQEIGIDQTVERVIEASTNNTKLDFYQSTSVSAKYVDHPDVKKVGSINLQFPANSKIIIELKFGKIEILAKAKLGTQETRFPIQFDRI